MKSGGTGNLPVYGYRELKSLEVSLVYVQQPQIPFLGEKDIHAPYQEEEDSAEETLLRDLPSDQRPPENQDTGSQNQRSDLADTFNLFKSYLDNKPESPFMIGY